MLSACTGANNSTPDEAGIVLQTGTRVVIDVSDVAQLGQLSDAQILIKTASPNFSASQTLLDLTSMIRLNPKTDHRHTVVLPKAIQNQRPLVVSIDLPTLNTQLISVIFDGDLEVKPGIASTLTYDLLKNYPGRMLTQYSGTQYRGIESLIDSRVIQLLTESEHLSLSTTRYDRLIKYFKNGLAFNISFLTQIQSFGVIYGWSVTTPPGLIAGDTPENSLTPYQYATGFTIGGSPAPSAPFAHVNTPARLMPGSASISPATGLIVLEGREISLSVQAFDIDDDFIDKNLIIQYLPRVLPSVASTSLIIPEPTPQYTIQAELSESDKVDSYRSGTIQFNEALDLLYYTTDGDTAYRNLYYMVSDGMMRVPYRWNFRYVDVNRQPRFVTNNNRINDTSLDDVLAPGQPEFPAGWRQHASHCETDPNASYTDGAGNTIFYQSIKSRLDGPWSCAFKVFDPDLDDDPNAAPDTFSYTVAEIDSFTEVKTNNVYIWPPISPFIITNPKRVTGATVATCTDGAGVLHRKCGQGLYQITIDNAVKVAAEKKADLLFNYDILVYDRTTNGLSTQRTVNRTVEFQPVPPRIVNFAAPSPGTGATSLSQITVDGSGASVYARSDTYLSEIFFLADTAQTVPTIAEVGFSNSLTGNSNRGAFLAGTANPISPYITQPRRLSGTFATFDPGTGVPLDGGAGTLELLGHSFTPTDVSTYRHPREYDSTCQLTENNSDISEGWDQNAPIGAVNPTQTGGWTFEINAIDYDNVGLRPGEPTDRVIFRSTPDIATSLFSNAGLLEYCNFTPPNSDIATYETYSAVGGNPAINPDQCNWLDTPPIEMQPVPVFYKVIDGGQPKVKKLVYHRLRIKWRPKDQGMQNKTIPDPTGWIRNYLAGVTLNGNRFANKGDSLDRVSLPGPIQLIAARRNMKPCASDPFVRLHTIHQQNQAPVGTSFNVFDENKVLAGVPYFPLATQGRYEAELRVLGNRGITDPEILKWIPFVDNCTSRDTVTPLGPSPTPPPVTASAEPIVFYSRMVDATHQPRIRLSTQTNAIAPTIGGMFCLRTHYSPSTFGGNPYLATVLIENLNTTSSHALALDPNCFQTSSITLHPDQRYVAIANRCSGLTLNQVLWSTPASIGTVRSLLNATTLGFPIGTPISFKLFPSLYQATVSSNKDASNSLFFDLNPIDTFVFNSGTGSAEYTGYQSWVPSNPSNLGPTPPPAPTPGNDFTLLTQYVDWDNGGGGSPLFMTIATPTPNPATSDVYYRPAPGDGTRIQVFVKNRAAVTFPIRSSDVASTAQVELDPYDVHQFSFGAAPVPAPANTPQLGGLGRADCSATPAGYPSIGTLLYSALAPFRTCQFSWTPSPGGADDGRRFIYAINLQDNANATPTVMGFGGRHPAAASTSIIPGDSLAKANGPTTNFFVDIEALETNVAPAFTSSLGGTEINLPYNSGGGASGWTNVFSGGIQPTCSAGAGFDCSLSVTNGDTLFSPTSIDLTEGVLQSFTVFGRDINVTDPLKTLSVVGSRPTKVLIADGPNAGKTYAVPSFASMSLLVSSDVPSGLVTISFSWTPTDLEANILSNPKGFLIPITLTDQAYSAASDTGFPSEFVVPALTKTVWIWTRVQTVNNTPQLFLVDSSNVETPLSGTTVQFQAGTAATYRIRIKDPDVARFNQTGETSGFSPAVSVPPFLTVSPAGAPSISGGFVVQDVVWGGTAGNSDLGTYTSPNVTVTDPGDPSLGLAIFPDAGSPPRARIQAATDSFGVPFNVQVIGKPIFQVPSTTDNTVFAYSGRPFSYPLSLFISRPSEMGQPMFVGIDDSTTITPVRRTLGGIGLYVSELHVLEWMNPLFADLSTPVRNVPLLGIRSSYCNPSLSSPAKTIIRFNKSTSQIETCRLDASSVSNHLSTAQSLSITLVNGTGLPSVPVLTATQVVRPFNPVPAPADTTLAINRQFADLRGRCGSLCTAPSAQVNTSVSGLLLNPSSSTGSIEYSVDAQIARMSYDRTSGLSILKTRRDTTPNNTRSILGSVQKGELLAFTANIASVPVSPQPHYRWYVNGCLRAAGQITSTTISFNQLVRDDMAGMNQDCTGQYGITEANATRLGKLIVRLSLVNSSELVTSSSDGGTVQYLWNLDIVNSNPSLQTDTSVAKSSPIVFDSASFYTGTLLSRFGFAVSYAGRSYFAYTDYAGSSVGLRVRLREISSTGGLLSSGFNLTCASNFSSQPNWLGIHPHSNGRLYIAASTVSSTIGPYPLLTSADQAYGLGTQTCFHNNLTIGNPDQNSLNLGGASSAPAGYLSFGQFTQAVAPVSRFTTSGSTYDDTSNSSSYFLLDGTQGSSLFWINSLASTYSSTPPEFSSHPNNAVRKNIVSGNRQFQFIGAGSNNQAGWRGSVLVSSLAQNGGVANRVDATIRHRIWFAGPAAIPPATANDCAFDGTPLDGVYDSNQDTLYVLAASNDGTGKGHIVQIQNAWTSPTCTQLGDTLNPSLNSTDFNPNMSKMILDSSRGLIYGVVNSSPGLAGQFYILDIFTKKLTARDVSASIVPYSIVHSPENNAVYIYDNRRSGSIWPTLYRVW